MTGGFTINLAAKPKKPAKPRKLSRLCLAMVIEANDGHLQAKVPKIGNDFDSECIIMNFTERSLALTDRSRIFLRHKDKQNHWVCVLLNDAEKARDKNIEDYRAFAPGNILSGYITNINNIYFFDYSKFMGYTIKRPVVIFDTIKSNKPLFSDDESNK